jgi:hypothetical protein
MAEVNAVTFNIFVEYFFQIVERSESYAVLKTGCFGGKQTFFLKAFMAPCG